MPGKEKRICPLLSMTSTEDEMCRRGECEWWRGSQLEGSCCVWDMAGWLSELHKLASGKSPEGKRDAESKQAKSSPKKTLKMPFKVVSKNKVEPVVVDDKDEKAIEDEDIDS